MAVVRRLNRRKKRSVEELNQMAVAAGWVPEAPAIVEAPMKGGRNVKAEFLGRYERRAISRRIFAIRDFDAGLCDPPRVINCQTPFRPRSAARCCRSAMTPFCVPWAASLRDTEALTVVGVDE